MLKALQQAGHIISEIRETRGETIEASSICYPD
jgi:hypothetical protein